MTHLLKKLANKIKALANAFMQSKLMKAWEQAAVKRAQYYVVRRTVQELQSLSDSELRDLGLGRGDIYDVAIKASKST